MKKLLVLLLLIGTMLFLCGCSEDDNTNCYVVVKKITDVGGCDQKGVCGVKYEDGTRGRAYTPTIGQYNFVTICE